MVLRIYMISLYIANAKTKIHYNCLNLLHSCYMKWCLFISWSTSQCCSHCCQHL